MVLGAVMVFRDVSERRQFQRQLELADRLATIGTMVAEIAHEVNNPLSYILANVGFVLEDVRQCLDEPRTQIDDAWMRSIQAALVDARDGTLRLGKIVADLTTFVRPAIESGEKTDLNEVLSWSIEVAGHALREHGRVVRRLGEVPPVCAGAGRLGQVGEVVRLLLRRKAFALVEVQLLLTAPAALFRLGDGCDELRATSPVEQVPGGQPTLVEFPMLAGILVRRVDDWAVEERVRHSLML